MFARLLMQSFLRQRRRKLLAGVAITLGIAVATAMLAVATDVGDKMNRELRSFGANILVTPQDAGLDLNLGGVELRPATEGGFLREGDLSRLKTIFWEHNILGFAPMLPLHAELNGSDSAVIGTWFAKPVAAGKQASIEGVRNTFPWWKVTGAWPRDDADEALIGATLAQARSLGTGDRVRLNGRTLTITGVVSADTATDGALIIPLAIAQAIANRPGAVQQVYVSAMTKPEDDYARRDPRLMGKA
ncbi:MAG TPA: ABC transporter permease, partial [Terriglobales bacterium]|nr:ABC transporter permease [Terriglobales bacterium]